MGLIAFTSRGMYCKAGDFFIDPWKPVQRALITHAHSDHARPGMAAYLAHHDSEEILKTRLGDHIRVQTVEYGRNLYINGVKVSFWPSGHLPGAAQIRLEHKGEVWVASGDYKVESDGLSKPFEPVACHTFISECTFGLPVFDWEPQDEVVRKIATWHFQNVEAGRNSVLYAYALGKAQRLIHALAPLVDQVWVHGAVAAASDALKRSGIVLPDYHKVEGMIKKSDKLRGQLIIAPPSARGTPWLSRFEPYASANCSGWMAIRGFRRRSQCDTGFVLSDHADWKGLLQAIKATKAKHIVVTHGYTDVFGRFLAQNGYRVQQEATRFSGESLSAEPQTDPIDYELS